MLTQGHETTTIPLGMIPDDPRPTMGESHMEPPTHLLDTRTFSLKHGNKGARLSPQQYIIMSKLMTMKRVSLDALIRAIYPTPDQEAGDGEGVVRVQICALRGKLKAIGSPWTIETMWGFGYILMEGGA